MRSPGMLTRGFIPETFARPAVTTSRHDTTRKPAGLTYTHARTKYWDITVPPGGLLGRCECTCYERARIVTWWRGEKTRCNLFFSYFGHFLFFPFLLSSARPPTRATLTSPRHQPPPGDSRRSGQISWFTFSPTHPGKGAVESAKMCRSASEIEKVDFGNTGGANRIRDTAGRQETGDKRPQRGQHRHCPGTVIVGAVGRHPLRLSSHRKNPA